MGLDTPVNKPPDGQISRLSRSIRGTEIPGFLLDLQGEPRSSPRSQFAGCSIRCMTLQTSTRYLQWRLLKGAASAKDSISDEQNELPGSHATLDSRPQAAPEIRDR